jgi:hypothetical protein
MSSTKRLISSRRIVCVLGATGCALLYSLRINLSVAIVAMVNHTQHEFHHHETGNDTLESEQLCFDISNNSSANDQENDEVSKTHDRMK